MKSITNIPQNMKADKPYFTTIQTAKLLGVSVRTVQLWVENGTLDAWKTAGGHRRIPTESVHKKLREQDTGFFEKKNDHQRNKRILIVEDNPTVSIFYKAAIGSWKLPIDITSAQDGFSGLVKIGQESPDLIISDIYMPGMDGLQMIQSLYKSQLIMPEQMIIISGLSDQEIRERGGIPADVAFFQKPVDVEKLKATIIDKFGLTAVKEGI
ncbi:MAG: excisionase family DNA binding protein [Dinoroseobacter sp.]|jgi:excisionase family DNA binding protein